MDDYVEETDLRYAMRRECAVEEWFGLKGDIRGPILLFVHLLSVCHRIHFLFLWFSTLCRTHSLPHTISLSFLVPLITFPYPNSSYQ